MVRFRSPRAALRAALVAVVLASLLVSAQSVATNAGRARLDTNVTISVITCCGSLEGFNDTKATSIFSMHNIYARLWNQKFPGIKFKETLLTSGTDVQTKLALAVNSGNSPDMVFIQGGDIGFTVMRKLAQPLDQYFKQYGVTDSYFLPGMARWAHFGGHWWGIPAVSGPLAGQLLFLPKYMTPLGYNNSNLRTFDDLYQMSKKAVQFDKSGNLTRIGYWPDAPSMGTGGGNGNYGMCPPGHGLYNAADQPTADDPCNVAYLTYLKKLADLYGGYAKVARFYSGDPEIWSESPKDYMATGKILISPQAIAYWALTVFDNTNFGVKGGLAYDLTLQPPTANGSLAEVANYSDTQQLIVIPPGAKHPDLAFALAKMICWDYGYLLGPSTNGSPVAKDQDRWLTAMLAGEAAARKRAGLPGNPAAHVQGLLNQPMLARLSKGFNPINPVNTYYGGQLSKAVVQVLYGQDTAQSALHRVQQLVLAQEQRYRSQYGNWNW
jgi:ABC-type glycerol-3-phosphate transport system substrate-binding protein